MRSLFRTHQVVEYYKGSTPRAADAVPYSRVRKEEYNKNVKGAERRRLHDLVQLAI